MRQGEVVADRFELVSLAGSGGMGEVWRAHDRVTGEGVALKLLRDGGGDQGRFAREAQVLAEMQHPGIVRYVAHGTHRDGTGDAWMAMEWLEGEDLFQRPARAALSSSERFELGRRSAGALGAAHALGVWRR